jgi:hypothetical protein
MWDAAAALGVPDQVIRKLIQCGLLPAKQVMPDAPWQIRVEDLRTPQVLEAFQKRRTSPRGARKPRRSAKRPITTQRGDEQ